MNRRFFSVTIAASVAAGLLFAGCSSAGRRTAQIKFGACDLTLGMTGDPAVFAFARDIGLDGVQFSIVVEGDSLPLGNPALQKAVLDASRETGVEIASFAVGQLNDIPYKSDLAAERYLSESVDIAKTMGIPVILVPFFGRGDLVNDPDGREVVIQRLKKLAPKAERAGIVLALESWLSAEDHMRIIDEVGSPAVKVYYDVANSQKMGWDILKEIRALGPGVVQIHAKDYKDLYGKGSMDFPAVRKAMEDIGYSGWFVMEGTQMPLGVEKSIKADLDYLKSIFEG